MLPGREKDGKEADQIADYGVGKSLPRAITMPDTPATVHCMSEEYLPRDSDSGFNGSSFLTEFSGFPDCLTRSGRTDRSGKLQ